MLPEILPLENIPTLNFHTLTNKVWVYQLPTALGRYLSDRQIVLLATNQHPRRPQLWPDGWWHSTKADTLKSDSAQSLFELSGPPWPHKMIPFQCEIPESTADAYFQYFEERIAHNPWWAAYVRYTLVVTRRYVVEEQSSEPEVALQMGNGCLMGSLNLLYNVRSFSLCLR